MRSNQASPRARGPALLRTGASATSSCARLVSLDASAMAGSLQGLLPGAPTDPDVRVKRIRFVTLGNRCPSHDWVVSRWHAGEARCPRRGSNSPSTTRHPLRSTGSGRAVPPLQHYYGALRLLAGHLAALRFLRLAIPSVRPLFVPISSGLSWGSSWSFCLLRRICGWVKRQSASFPLAFQRDSTPLDAVVCRTWNRGREMSPSWV